MTFYPRDEGAQEGYLVSGGAAALAMKPRSDAVFALEEAIGASPPESPTRSKEMVLNFSNLYWGDEKCAQVIDAVRAAAPGPAHLDLRGNRFGAAGVKTLAEYLARGPHPIASICLEWNNVGYLDEGIEALARALEADSTLLALDLRNNNIGPEGAKALARALYRNRTLRRLDLRWNEIGGAGVLAFREALQSNQSILTLELMGNNCSLKQVDEIEKMLARNQAIQEDQKAGDAHCNNSHQVAEYAAMMVVGNNACTSAANSPQKPSRQDEHHSDKLLLHVLAEKEELEATIATSKKEKQKLSERVDELEAHVTLLQKEATVAKEDRDRYQTRETDAKRDVHELKMKLDELENRRALEFEEYRSSRLALEKENVLAREKLLHVEALGAKSAEQKSKQLAQLEEETYRLQGELHRMNLGLCTKEAEVDKLTKQLGDTQREYERKEASLVASHESKLAAAVREHELAVRSLQSQLQMASASAEASQQAAHEHKEKAETLQAKVLAAEIEHERSRAELKKQWEMDVQDRVQRTVSAVEAQLEEVKKGRQRLEREVDKHLLSIAQLREEKAALQQTQAQQSREHQEELAQREQELCELGDRLRTAQMEQQQAEEARMQQERRFADLTRRMEQTQAALEERIQRLAATEKARTEEFGAVMAEKSNFIAELEKQVARLEREGAAQRHEHDRRMDELADSFTAFIQEQMHKERARRKLAAEPTSVATSKGSTDTQLR